MCQLPATLERLLSRFAPVFSRRIWRRVQVLLVGALLTPGARTVAAALRAVGLAHERRFASYHRVLSRATWSARALSPPLLALLVRTFVPPAAPVVVGLDETLERRRGKKIWAKGLYHDPCRSGKAKKSKVNSYGLRWISLMLLARVSWAQRVWALPFLSLLVPSQAYCTRRGRRYKTLSVWGRQAIGQLRRWLPDRELVVVADHAYCALELLDRARRWGVTLVTRFQFNAALYDPPPSRDEVRGRHRSGRLPTKGARQPSLLARLHDPRTVWQRVRVAWYGGTERTIELASGTAVWYSPQHPRVPLRWVLVRDPAGSFEPLVLACTCLEVKAAQVVEYFVLRWQVEVTFQEVRAHLGVETQRQWSEAAIARTTPLLLGLFSLVTLWAQELGAAAGGAGGEPTPLGVLGVRRPTAWYPKRLPTFVDALALVRQQLWPLDITCPSTSAGEMVVIPRALLDRLRDTLAFAA